MSGILAIFERRGTPVDPGAVAAMLAVSPERARDGQRVWLGPQVALAHQRFCVTPQEQGEEQPLVDPLADLVIACDARLDNRPELIAALAPGDDRVNHSASDAAIVLAAYRRWGTDCAARLLGDFAFVIWDGQAQQLFLARDALGAFGLCYYADSQVFLAASEVRQILAHPAIRPRLNEGKIAEYLEFLWDNQDETFFEDIYYCPSAHCLTVTAGAIRQWRYWEIDPEARIRYKDDRQYAEHFRALLAEAVRCRLRAVGPVGISLSGGLDSTSVAALAAPLLAGQGSARLKSFSYAFDELASCDERAYIRPVVEHYGIDAVYIPCDDKWTLRDLARWPVWRDFVFWDAYAWLPIAVCEAAHAAGCRVLLTGHYGDLLYEGAQYWAADMLRDLRLGSLRQALMAGGAAIDWRYDLVRFGLWQQIPVQWKRTYRRRRPRPMTWRNPGLHPDLIRRIDLAARSRPDPYWQRFTASGQEMRYRALVDGSMSQGQAALRHLVNAYGLEMANPYHDRRLVEFVMALPADQLGRPYRTKWILREAMAGLLPETVRERPFGTNFSPLFELGLKHREQATVRTILLDAQIVRRRYVRSEWLEQELSASQTWAGDGIYLWLYISLELWLRRYWPDV